MKKTLIISFEYPPQIGGIATYVHQFAAALPRDQVVVLAPPSEGSKEWDEQAGYTVVRGKFLFPRFIWPRWMRLYFLVRKLCKVYAIEQLYVHHMIPSGYVTYLLKKKYPYLVFSHGTDMVLATRNRWKRMLTERVLGASKHVFVNSNSLRLRFIERIPSASEKVTVVYPCPDALFQTPPDAARLDELRSSLALEGKQVVLTIARLDDGKGIPQLVRTIAELLPSQPNLVWILIGDGPKKQLVMELVQEYKLQNVVRYLGAIPHDQLRQYYYLADSFVLLTHPDGGREEGLGLVFLEAAAAGLPIVAGKSGGVEEAVSHTQTGLVVNTYNHAEVAAAIAKILRDKTFASALGTAAQERIISEFSWEHQLSRIEQWL